MAALLAHGSHCFYSMTEIYRGMQHPCLKASSINKASNPGWRIARAHLSCPLSTRPACYAAARTCTGRLTVTSVVLKNADSASYSSKRIHQGPSSLVATSRFVGRRVPASSRLVRTPAAVPEFLASLAVSTYRDYYVVALAAVGAAVWVKIFDLLAVKGVLEQKLSRKLVHTTSGPLFLLTWTLFSAAPSARYLAAVVPMLNGIRLLAVGSGLVRDQGLVKSVSRSGDRGELLKGPLVYVAALVAATALSWRDNPAGLIAVSMMCGGDGLADIVGRRWGAAAKLPWNNAKSWAGSFAMLVGGYGMSYGLILLFCNLGFFSCYPPAALLSCLGAIALAATIVESLPINQVLDDNVSVPLVAGCLSMLLLPQPVEAVAELAVAATMAAAAAAATATPVGLVL
ncbi:hypothetical protein VaNZ11_008854 [Volvox africanus]|uniref:phytol kinase n=1 Tax=Volvox africanus TaxID=51714 RepID=A0ABQ5S5X8_9CHLO|nr:hypothetical protein VaNZ11_008854 [Volvox africanus]